MKIALPNGVWDIEWVEGVLFLNGESVEAVVNKPSMRIVVANDPFPMRTAILTAIAVADAARTAEAMAYQADPEVIIIPITARRAGPAHGQA